MGKQCLVGMGRAVKIPRDISCMAVAYRNCRMHLGKYMVHAWLDLVTKMQKYTSFPYSRSTSEECKKWDAVCISNRGSGIDRMERYQIVKTGVFFRGLLSKILRSSSQFCEIQTGGWSREVFHVIKKKTIRKWELNTSDLFMNLRTESFFVGRCRSNIYTLWIKYYQKYTQDDIEVCYYLYYVKGPQKVIRTVISPGLW